MSSPNPRNPEKSRKRQVIRRSEPVNLADFDEQLWPINLAVLVLAGLVAGVVYATTDDFFDPRILHNGVFRLSIVALLVALVFWATAFFRTRTARRVQFCVILSLVIHLLLVVFLREQYLELVERWKDDQVAAVETDEPLTVPEYFSETLENPEAVPDFAKPVETATPEADAQRYEVAPEAVEQPPTVPQPEATERTPAPEPVPAVLPRAELSAPRRVETPTNPPKRQVWQHLPQPEEPQLTPETPVTRSRPARELSPRAEAERRETVPRLRPQPELTETTPSALQPQRAELARPAPREPEPVQPTTPTPTRKLSAPTPLNAPTAAEMAAVTPSRSQPARSVDAAQAAPERRETLPAPSATLAASPRLPQPAVEAAVGPRRTTGEDRGTAPLSRGIATGSRQAAAGTVAAASPALSNLPPAAGNAGGATRALEASQVAVQRRASIGLPNTEGAGTESGAESLSGLLAGNAPAMTRRTTGEPGAELIGAAGARAATQPTGRRGLPAPNPGMIAAAAPMTQPVGRGTGALRGAQPRYEPRSGGVAREEARVGAGTLVGGSGGAGSGESGTGAGNILAAGLGPAASGSGSGTALRAESGEGDAASLAGIGRIGSSGRRRAAASMGLPGAELLAAAESGTGVGAGSGSGAAEGEESGSSDHGSAAGNAPQGPNASALALAGPAGGNLPALPLGSPQGQGDVVGLGTIGGSLGDGGTGIGNRAAGEIGDATAAVAALGGTGGTARRRGAVGAGNLPGLIAQARPVTQPGASEASGTGGESGSAATGALDGNGTATLAGPRTTSPDVPIAGSEGGGSPGPSLLAGVQAGPRRLTGEGTAQPIAATTGGGPIRRRSIPGMLPGMDTSADLVGARATTSGGSAPSGAGRTPGARDIGPQRREGGLTVSLTAETGIAGISGPAGLTPGLTGRLARSESDIISPLRSRAMITRRAAGLPGLALSTKAVPLEAYRQRMPSERLARANELGGGPETERAVELGLDFLARIQFPDGHWSLNAVPEESGIDPDTFHTGNMQGDTAATGTALLAFLGAGYTHLEGKHADTVKRALAWLLANQGDNGQLFRGASDANPFTRMYGQGIATIALCEAYGLSQDPALREPAEKAIGYILAAQHPDLGGWRYQPRRESDTSVTGWQLMALKSAQMTGIDVPEAAFRRVGHWLDLAQAEDGARYRYNPYAADTDAQRHGRVPNRAMTAEGLLMRIYLGWQRDHEPLRRGAEFLRANLPAMGSSSQPLRDVYYWYYATQVMFQMQGEYWEEWNGRMRPLLVDTQITEGPLAGSWDPRQPVEDPWADAAGRLYVTSLQLLTLEVYYRYLKLFDTLQEESRP